MTFTRGDVHCVLTEYGITYLHGKNIRKCAMDLIAIPIPSSGCGSRIAATGMNGMRIQLVFRSSYLVPLSCGGALYVLQLAARVRRRSFTFSHSPSPPKAQ